KDQGLLTLESDKATLEVPAPFAGVVKELRVKVGDSLSEGSVVALIEEQGDASADNAAPAAAAASRPAPESSPDRKPETKPESKPEPSAAADAAAAPAHSGKSIASAGSVDPDAAGPRTPPV